MPHIFRFHAGRNNNIYDWKSSDRINSTDVKDVKDKTNIITSAAGTSIPTPIARMFLFKTAFEIVAAQVRDNDVDKKSIYSGLVSECLDLLELLYKNGSDENKFSYEKWVFDNSQKDDNIILDFFGNQHGHRLLAESFKQAAGQEPFNNRIEITLIYYTDGLNRVLVGGTSPFTFVFTSPNFKRKLRARNFKPISGLVSEDYLFDADYKQLHERDETFIRYIESLVTTQDISNSFQGFAEFVINTKDRFYKKFNGITANLQDIHIGDLQLKVSGISLKQVKQDSYKQQINTFSDFKIELPDDTSYAKNNLTPLFLLDRMDYDGQYTSPNSFWSNTTRISENEYPETTLNDITNRELPAMDGIVYPFLTSFDFFERCLVTLPGYFINDERFVTLVNNQSFALPLKPLFFHFFPIQRIKNYLKVEQGNQSITFVLTIPVSGITKKRREIIFRKTYDAITNVQYSGIIGIFPFTKAIHNDLLHINKYTVASFEKTNTKINVNTINFYKKTGIDMVTAPPVQRSNYSDINTKSKYLQVDGSFDIIQLNFTIDNANCGCVILPKFIEVANGTEEYVFAIDFGTSNTHIEFGRIVNDKLTSTEPFSIGENEMQMYLLHKPKEVAENDGALKYLDYERSIGTTIDGAKQITLREFVPFQIGMNKVNSIKFPFRTATCESNAFGSNQSNNRLFIDANIGFNIDEDSLRDDIKYKTDLKWLLQKAINDPFNQNRITIFFNELLLMIRTKVLLQENFTGDINLLKLALSFPLSMGDTLKNLLISLFNAQKNEVFGERALEIVQVTESIAPYYQLRFKDSKIQNGIYCNIDIGGGTTDIVISDNNNVEKPNELLCYCSSFKFAGRQLWGSGSNEFNLEDNGFVSFYKKFIQKADLKVYHQLEKVLNSNANRTEDVLGLLFSRPEYKFIDIFSENTEFKAVLLIHYSSILFYITRLAKINNINLPRTVSFSGKGSEYLNLIFPSNNDLKSFTQRVLAIFAGTEVRPDFIIDRSNEPKVITAKGAAHFATEKIDQIDDAFGINTTPNSNEKKLTLNNTNFIGFKNIEFEALNLAYIDLSKNNHYFNDILESLKDFFNLLFDDVSLCDAINKKLQLKNFAKYKQFFIPDQENIHAVGSLQDSFKSTLHNIDQTEKIVDSPFFFPLNYSLIELSKEISQTA